MNQDAGAVREEHLTVQEVAADLKCDEDHVCDLIKAGKLKARRIGLSPRSPYRVPIWAYREFLADTLVNPSPAA